jgi:glycosyltransferase involved in cell wall biosynthesis
MRILVHDYSGHPFQVQLSRWLAARGHEVLHLYSSAIASPRGKLQRTPDDPAGFRVEAVALPRPVDKYNPVRRALQERDYGRRLAARLTDFRPDAVLSGNCSPAIQNAARAAAARGGARFAYWVQDLYADAAERLFRAKLGPLAAPLVAWTKRYEARAIAAADAAVIITEDFRPLLAARGVPPGRLSVVENWAPLDEVPPRARDTDWRRELGLEDAFVFLYAGTLGLKHNPGLLAALADAVADRPEVRVVVVSEGKGRDWLEVAKAEHARDNLVLLDFQPYERLPEVLASADVLLAILEPFAGVLSVPSKVLTSLCAGRPILAAVPPENLAARVLEHAGAGLAVPPDDAAAFAEGARRLYEDPELRARCAAAGRAFAERAFDIEAIGRRFLAVLEGRTP